LPKSVKTLSKTALNTFDRFYIMYCDIKDIADKDRLQKGIDKLVNWTDKWQVKLNVDKCKVISFHHRRYLNRATY